MFAVALENDDIEEVQEYFHELNAAKSILIAELNGVPEPSIWLWKKILTHVDADEGTIIMIMEAESLKKDWNEVLTRMYPDFASKTKVKQLTMNEVSMETNVEEKEGDLFQGQYVSSDDEDSELKDIDDVLPLEQALPRQNERTYMKKPQLTLTEGERRS